MVCKATEKPFLALRVLELWCQKAWLAALALLDRP